eukprot:8032180-Prorocentrum_lima.AAC.1
MTSSLVGSEMCIRDRLERGREEVGEEVRLNVCVVVLLPCVRFVFRVVSVSYTHLTLPTICSV